MSRLKVAVIGIGHLGTQYARIYAETPGVELIALCDPSNKKNLAEKYKTFWYSDYRQIMGKVDAASIVVPTPLHYQIAKDFLKKGVPVLLEKPMTETIKQAGELIRIAQDKKTVLQIGHIERFNPAIRKLKQLLREVRFVEIHRLGPYPERGIEVSVVLDLMIHDLDIILNIIDSPLDKISAIGIPVISSKEDIANVRLSFKNKSVANLTASRITDKFLRKIRVFEPNRYWSLDYSAQELIYYEKGGADSIKKHPVKVKKEEPLKSEIFSFLESVRKKKSPLIPGEEGKRVLQIALKIEKEMRE